MAHRRRALRPRSAPRDNHVHGARAAGPTADVLLR